MFSSFEHNKRAISEIRLCHSAAKPKNLAVNTGEILREVYPERQTGENAVHGSTRLTTNGVVSFEIEYLSVRPERRRRAPREFSHSLTKPKDSG